MPMASRLYAVIALRDAVVSWCKYIQSTSKRPDLAVIQYRGSWRLKEKINFKKSKEKGK